MRFFKLLFVLTVVIVAGMFSGFALASEVESKASITYRALSVGCGKYNSGVQLSPSPENDAEAFAEAIKNDPRFDKSSVYVYQNLKLKGNKIAGDKLTAGKEFTAAELIQKAFAGADDDDISYFFMSSHGNVSNGVTRLIFSDNATMTYDELRAALDKVKGTKVVILDSCYSGGAISKSAAAETQAYTLFDTRDSIAAVVSENVAAAFGSKTAKAGGPMIKTEYKVLTASSLYELSWGEAAADSSYPMGLYTRSMLLGCGWFRRGASMSHAYADTDGDGEISLAEIFRFTRDDNWFSQAQVYPQNDNFVFFTYPRSNSARTPLYLNPKVTHTSPYKLTLEFPQKANIVVSIYSYVIEGTRNGGVYFKSNNIKTLFNGNVQSGKRSFTFTPDKMDDLRYVFSIQEKGSTVNLCVPFATDQGKPTGRVTTDGEFTADGVIETPVTVYFSSNCAIEVGIYLNGSLTRLLAPAQAAIPLKASEYASMNYTRFWWDGRDDKGNLVAAGKYKIQVKLIGNAGTTYITNTISVSR